jgi:hypothetical protein
MSQSRFEDEDDVIAAFWQQYEHLPGISRKKITNYKGDGTMYDTDTRCAFVEFIDALSKDGSISSEMADTITLDD